MSVFYTMSVILNTEETRSREVSEILMLEVFSSLGFLKSLDIYNFAQSLKVNGIHEQYHISRIHKLEMKVFHTEI